jgi:hypothetical protein
VGSVVPPVHYDLHVPSMVAVGGFFFPSLPSASGAFIGRAFTAGSRPDALCLHPAVGHGFVKSVSVARCVCGWGGGERGDGGGWGRGGGRFKFPNQRKEQTASLPLAPAHSQRVCYYCHVTSPPGDPTVRKCSASTCGKFYHMACARKMPLTRMEGERLYCPVSRHLHRMQLAPTPPACAVTRQSQSPLPSRGVRCPPMC